MLFGLRAFAVAFCAFFMACTANFAPSAERLPYDDESPEGGRGGGEGGAGEGGSSNDEGSSGDEGGNDFPEKAPPPASACKNDAPGPRTLRRLTSAQLTATVRDLFGEGVPANKVFDDPLVLGFKRDADKLVVRGLGAQQIMDYAEEVARWAVANELPSLSPCQKMDASCRKSFITSFGKRVFRAPLKDETISAYEKLFAAEPTFAEGAEATIAAMLQSPLFLYRSEIGEPQSGNDARFTLTPHEVASSLSYLITGSMPDSALMAAADAGELKTRAQIDEQVERLLDNGRSQDVVAEFMVDWLELSHLQTAVKEDKSLEFDTQLRSDMLAETRAFVIDNFKQKGSLADLFTAKHTFVNANLSSLYKLNGVTGQSFSRVELPSGQREGGILAHASILAGHANATGSSPTFRGKLVRTRLLCQDLPPPPANLDTMLKPPGNATTTRQRFEQHATDAACAACHDMMDPIGYAFEHYDGFGRWRDQENGTPIDARGKVMEVEGGDVEIDGLQELSTFLSTSPDVQRCMVRFWSYFAFGKSAWSEDACTYEAVGKEAAEGGFSNDSVIRALTHAPHFTTRVKDL